MKTHILTLFLSFLFLGFVYAQDELTLEEVLDNYYQAVGTEKLKDVETIVQSGHLDMSGNTITRITYLKRPNKFRNEMDYMGNKFITIFDGTNGWTINPMSGSTEPQPLDSATLADLAEQVNFEGLLYNYKDKGYEAELDGIEDVNGTDTYVIHLHKKDRDIWIYLDTESFIPIQQKVEAVVKGRQVKSTISFSNYKQVDGIAFPFLTSMTGQGPMGQMQLVTDSIKLNVPIPDSLFTIKTKEQ